MFAANNTEGFSATDLANINEVLAQLVASGMDEGSASDRVNNAWFEGATADDLRAAVGL